MAITKNSFLKITPITPDIGGTDTTTSIARTFTHRVEDLTTLGVYFDGQLIQADTEPVILTDAKFYYTVSTSLTTVNAGSFVIGDWYQIKTTGDTNFVSIGADSTTVGVAFVATGIGSGTGTAYSLSKTIPGTDTITITIKPNTTYVGNGYATGSSTGGSASFNNNVMTLTVAPSVGSIVIGQTLTAAGVESGAHITALLTGTLNVVGSTYTVWTPTTSTGVIGAESITTGHDASTSAFLSSDSFIVSYYYNQYTEV